MQNPSGDENTGLLSGCPCPSTTACDGNNNNNNNDYQTIPSPVNSQEAAALSAALSEVERRRNKEKKVLLGALVFCFIFMVIEFAAGIVAHSLALLTDAIHLLTDVGAYGLSIGALIAASQVACGKYNYGWHRAEVIGTLISVFSIWALVLWIVVEAFSRMYDIYMCSYGPAPEGSDPRQCHEINSELMILVGFLGMLVNITCAAILYFGGSHGHSHFGGGHNHSHGDGEDHGHDHGSAIVHMDDDHDHDHNHDHGSHHDHDHSHSHGRRNSLGKVGFAVNAALLHALGDCVQSVGVILAGLYIYAANRYSYGVPSTKHSLHNLADPFCSIMFAIITLNMTRSLLMDLLNILMESTPSTIDFQSLEVALGSIESVVSVHDLHVWSLSRDYLSLSVHLVADSPSDVLRKAKAICSQFGITHTTIQVDSVSDGSAMCVGSCGSPANCSAPGVEHTH